MLLARSLPISDDCITASIWKPTIYHNDSLMEPNPSGYCCIIELNNRAVLLLWIGFCQRGRWEVDKQGSRSGFLDRSTGKSGLHNSGSSPASPTKEDSRKAVSFFASRSSMKRLKPLDFQWKRKSRGIFVPFLPIRFCSLPFLPIPVDLVGEKGGAFVRFLTYVHMRYFFL